jgi:hypothetical protein
MPAPNRLTRKLNEILGTDAGDAMADWMNRADESAGELRREIDGFRQEVRADFAELRQEMHAEFARVRQEMTEGLGSVRSQMAEGLGSVRSEMTEGLAVASRETAEVREEVRVGLANLEKTMAQRHAEFLRWMVGFWLLSLVTLVGSVVALARILA